MPTVELEGMRGARAPKLVDVVAQKVSELILARKLLPGDPLPKEHEISTAYGVSRSVVREALVELKALGVVEIRHGKGAFVGTMPVELLLTRVRQAEQEPDALLKEMWEVRAVIEAAIAGFAAERRTDADLAALEQAIDSMDASIKSGGTGSQDDLVFHLYLTRAAHNSVMEQMVTGMANLIEPSRLRSLERPGRPASSNREHRGILAAVRSGDAEGARQAMQTHITNGRLLTTIELER